MSIHQPGAPSARDLADCATDGANVVDQPLKHTEEVMERLTASITPTVGTEDLEVVVAVEGDVWQGWGEWMRSRCSVGYQGG